MRVTLERSRSEKSIKKREKIGIFRQNREKMKKLEIFNQETQQSASSLRNLVHSALILARVANPVKKVFTAPNSQISHRVDAKLEK